MSQEKLTLEHLLAYAEHSVFVDIITALGTKSTLILNHYTVGLIWNSLVAGMDVKLRLRPMSDIEDFFEPLYGQLEHQDVTDFLDEDYLNEFGNLEVSDIQNWKIETLPFGLVKVLLKHHFDIFGLIPKGLAISTHCFSFAN
jgi:hypothetical protein